MSLILEGLVEVHTEDGGMSMISEDIYCDPDLDHGLFVRLQSWDRLKKHADLSALAGKKVRVTIEVLDV